MEPVLKNMTMVHTTFEKSYNITLEDDINVPEKKGDVKKIIFSDCDVISDQPAIRDGKLGLSGKLNVRILYMTEGADTPMDCLTAAIPFEDEEAFEEASSGSDLRVRTQVWDLDISVVNSRKISVRAVIINELCGKSETRIEAIEKLDESCLVKNKIGRQLVTVHDRKDILRVKEQIELPKEMPNAGNIIYSYSQIRNLDCKCRENYVLVKGEMYIFALYSSEEDEKDMRLYDALIPFEGKISLNGINEEMLCEVKLNRSEYNIQIRPDLDGEPRMLEIELSAGVDAKVYCEQEYSLIEDAYSLDNKLELTKMKTYSDTLVMKNYMRRRLSGKYKCPQRRGHILQIGAGTAEVNLDEVRMTMQSIAVSGVVKVKAIYICQDDDEILGSTEKEIPFNAEIEAAKLSNNCTYSVIPCVENVSITMSGEDEIEAKVSIGLEVLILESEELEVITDIKQTPYEEDNLPLITGVYICEEQEIWDIAKAYHSTPQSIMSVNGIGDEKLYPGQKLVVMNLRG